MKFEPAGPPRYAHQKKALRRIIETRGVHALLMEPGTGKTAVALDYLSILALKNIHDVGGIREVRALVISPKAAVDNWVLQAETYVHPGVNVWAEALGGSIKQKAETFASRGPFDFKPRGYARMKDRKQQPHRGINSDRAELLWTRGASTRRPIGPADITALGRPRLILLSTNLDTFASRASSGSGTIADTLVKAVTKFEPDVIVVDECHPAGTHVETPAGPRPIEELKVGDEVLCYNGEGVETTRITHTFKRETEEPLWALGGLKATPEHPVWTETRGFVPISDLEAGDEVVRVLRGDVLAVPGEDDATVLFEVVQQAGHVPGPAGASRTAGRPPAGDTLPAGGRFEVVGSLAGALESVSEPGGLSSWLGDDAVEAWLDDAERGKWDGVDLASAPTFTETRLGYGSRGDYRLGGTVLWLPESLQGGHRGSGDDDRGGDRWGVSSVAEGSGPAEGRVPPEDRLGRVSLHEPAGSDGPGQRRHVYNIETEAGTYIAGGYVVHNSHKIKGPSSNTSRLVARIGERTDRRMILTGTVMPHALTLDSPILTPSGWKPMGEMQVGDQVIGADGQPTEVVGVWPQGERPIFTVTFSDGSTVDCTEDHLWTVTSRGRRSRGLPPLTLPTGDLVKGRSRSRATPQEVGLFDKGGSARWAIPTVEPVDFPSKPVPLDSYLVGLLLGDGHLGHSVDFTTADEEIVKYAGAALPTGLQLTMTPGQNGSRASRYRITSGKKGGSLLGTKRGPAPNAVAVALNELGMRGLLGPEKFVPEVYLWNDRETRLGVLRGLMDADGTASVGSTSKFVTTSPRLAEGVTHLVRSLGGYVTERVEQKQPTIMPQGNISSARPQHVLLLGMPFNPFRVTRKAEQWRPRTEPKLRTIVGVEPRGIAPAQCITVSAPDGLFVTQDFVATHNSPMDVFAQWRFLKTTAFGEIRDGERQRASFTGFQRKYGVMGGFMGREVVSYRNLDEMQAIMADNATVVRKEDALDLPQMTDTVIPITLSSAEQRAYEDMKKNLAASLASGQLATAPNKLAQMMRLRQITSGHLPDGNGAVAQVGTSKVDAINSLVTDTLAGEKRVVVFGVFRQEIADIEAAISNARGEPTDVIVITGDTAPDERLSIRRRFGSSDPRRIVLIAQVKTISLSVNELVTASHAVFATLSLQRDDLVQARDRLNRIGQTRPCTFWYPLARGTVDEITYRSHQGRTDLEAAVLEHVREADGESSTPPPPLPA